MSLFLPFNYKPDTTSVKTGEYTVPVGRYAFIYDNSNTLSIDSIDVGRTDADIVFTSNATSINSIVHTAPSDGNYSWHISRSSGASTEARISSQNTISSQLSSGINQEVNVLLTTTATFSTNGTIYLKEGQHLRVSMGTTGTQSFTLAREVTATSNPNWIPVPEGTVLNGQNYTVVEYIIA